MLALLVSASVARNGFAQDDFSIIQESDRLHGFDSWYDILTLPYWPPPASPDLYRPVTSFWLALQYVIGNGSPVVYHIVSAILFAITAVLVYRLATRVMPQTPALVTATLFAAHPVHVEAIALAVGQAELLVAIIALACVTMYIDWRRSAVSLSIGRWIFLIIAYLIAALSKENGLVIPALLICAELVIENGSLRDRIPRLWAGFVAMAFAGALVIFIRSSVLSHLGASIAADAIRNADLPGRVLTMLRTAPEWFRLFVWPVHLRAEYSPQEFLPSSGFGASEAVGLSLLLVTGVAAVAFRRKRPAVTFAIGWAIVALLPVANIILPSGILIGERTLFLASVGPCLIAGMIVERALTAARERQWVRQIVLAGCAGLVLICGIRSISRFRVWENNRTLTLYSMTDSPRSWRVQQAYAELLFDEGRIAEGSAAFNRAVEYAPEKWRPRNRFAERLLHTRRDDEALAQLEISLSEYPGRIETLIRLPAALLAVGNYPRARALADSIIVAENSPPIMIAYRTVADSAIKLKAPPGSVRVFPF